MNRPARAAMRARLLAALLAALLIAGALAACRPAPPDTPGEAEAATLPSLPVRDLHGHDAIWPGGPLERGRLRIVNVWAPWCAPCRRELPSLQRAQAQWQAQADVHTLVLSDDAFAVREYLRQASLTLPTHLLAQDAARNAGLALDALPQTFLVDSGGRVLMRVRGAREWDDAASRTLIAGVVERAQP
jgi:thiol-disulfide isomerase/thioredoxin